MSPEASPAESKRGMGGMIKVQRDALSRIWPTQPATVCAQHAEVNRRSAKDPGRCQFLWHSHCGAVLLALFHRPQERTRQPIRSRVRAGHLISRQYNVRRQTSCQPNTFGREKEMKR